MRYIALLLLFPLVAFGQSTTQLVDRTTGSWLSPAPALVKSGNGLGLVANPLSQFAATTSLQLLNNITDETGTGALVFATSPTLVTPVIGEASATSVSLPATSSSTVGVINQGGVRMVHSYGSGNLFFGPGAGSFTLTGTNNVGIGSAALDTLTNGAVNVAIGESALTLLTSGQGNVAIGRLSGDGLNTHSSNTSMGTYSMRGTGAANTAVGMEAIGGQVASNADSNTAIGTRALYGLTTGDFNIAIGRLAGDAITTGASNIVIGYDLDVPSATSSNQINIGGVITSNGTAMTFTQPIILSSDPNADRLAFFDDSFGGLAYLTLSGLTITGTSLAVDAATDSAAGVIEENTTAEAQAGTSDDGAMSPADVVTSINNSSTVTITSDNQVVTVGNTRFLTVTSDNATATNRTFSISDGTTGQTLVLYKNTTDTNNFELVANGSTLLKGTWPTAGNPGDYWVALRWNGQKWNEENRLICPEENYATAETLIGSWLGSPLYRKTIDIGTLPNTTTSTDAHGISGGSFSGASFKRIYGYATNGTETFNIPMSGPNYIFATADGTNISVSTGANWTAFSGPITVEYTK